MSHHTDAIYTKRYRVRARAEAIAAYGGKCACCGESNPKFLTLDHIGNDGGKHRTVDTGASRICTWARRNGYPKTLQLLCANCNFGRRWNMDICPHAEPVPPALRPLAEMYGFVPQNSEYEYWVENPEWSLL